jgi:hypothetical protein
MAIVTFTLFGVNWIRGAHMSTGADKGFVLKWFQSKRSSFLDAEPIGAGQKLNHATQHHRRKSSPTVLVTAVTAIRRNLSKSGAKSGSLVVCSRQSRERDVVKFRKRLIFLQNDDYVTHNQSCY